MVERSVTDLDAVFAALADPTRRAILGLLAHGEASVGELAEPFDISLAAVSKHLQVLERAGLLTRRVEGRVHRIALQAQPLAEATGWLAHYARFWDASFDGLAAALAEDEEQGR